MRRTVPMIACCIAAFVVALGPGLAVAQDGPKSSIKSRARGAAVPEQDKSEKDAESPKADDKAESKDDKSATKDEIKNEFAVLGGGCFWCLEAVYERIPGVKDVVSGYAGGDSRRPTYEQVGSGLTGHAEVVRVEFDPKVISFDKILHIFFEIHDPTTLNSQGPDFGTQYRSIILAVDQAQRDAALKEINALEQRRAYRDPIVTEVVPLKTFYPAEKYHQDYFRLHPSAAYCQQWIVPKVQKMMQKGEIPPIPPRQAAKKKR